MSDVTTPGVTLDSFTATVEPAAEGLLVTLVGEADYSAVVPFDGFLRGVHQQAALSSASEVVVDLRQLKFMNSACFKCIVTWLRRLDGGDAAKCSVRFVADPNTHWLRASLSALKAFAGDRVSVSPTV